MAYFDLNKTGSDVNLRIDTIKFNGDGTKVLDDTGVYTSVSDSKIGDRTIQNPETDSGQITGLLTILLNKFTSAIRGLRANITAHINRTDNPHSITKAQVGLDNVDNIKQASKIEFDTHITDTDIHVTPQEKAEWDKVDNKQDKLTAGANINIDEDNVISATGGDIEQVVEDLNEHTSDTDIHTTAEEKIEWGAISALYKGEFDFGVIDTLKEYGLYTITQSSLGYYVRRDWLFVSDGGEVQEYGYPTQYWFRKDSELFQWRRLRLDEDTGDAYWEAWSKVASTSQVAQKVTRTTEASRVYTTTPTGTQTTLPLSDFASGATIKIAASNASAKSKASADYVCSGVNDEVELNAAVQALPVGGGSIELSEGTFYLGNQWILDIAETWVRGQGKATVVDAVGVTGGVSVRANASFCDMKFQGYAAISVNAKSMVVNLSNCTAPQVVGGTLNIFNCNISILSNSYKMWLSNSKIDYLENTGTMLIVIGNEIDYLETNTNVIPPDTAKIQDVNKADLIDFV